MPGSNIVASQGPPKTLKRHNYSFRFLGGGVTASQLYFEISRSIFVTLFRAKGVNNVVNRLSSLSAFDFATKKIILLPILHLFRFWRKHFAPAALRKTQFSRGTMRLPASKKISSVTITFRCHDYTTRTTLNIDNTQN